MRRTVYIETLGGFTNIITAPADVIIIHRDLDLWKDGREDQEPLSKEDVKMIKEVNKKYT